MGPIEPERYEPPPEVEGKNNGLIESMAETLWIHRTQVISPINRKKNFKDQTEEVKKQWRATAREAVGLLLNLGFVGPGGDPKFNYSEWTYGWLYNAASWEIMDDENGFVALVNEEADLALMLAAPRMRLAIKEFLAAFPPDHPRLEMAEVVALMESLPPEQEKPRSRDYLFENESEVA